MKEGIEKLLEKARGEKVYDAAVKVQSLIRCNYQRKKYLNILKSNIVIQRIIRVSNEMLRNCNVCIYFFFKLLSQLFK